MDSLARISGVFCGLVLLGLLAAGILLILRPCRQQNSSLALAIVVLAAIGIAKLFLLRVFPGHWFDVQCWNMWSIAMAHAGPFHIYDRNFLPEPYECDYPPGYLYALWFAGKLAGAIGVPRTLGALRLVTESPPIAADFLLGLSVFCAIRRFGPSRMALLGMLLFAANPSLLFDTVVWGQNDSALTLPILLSTLLVLDSHYGLGSAVAAIAVLIKPQGLILLPAIGFWTVLNAKPRDWMRAAAAFASTFLIGIFPFQVGHPWSFLGSVVLFSTKRYSETSVNAFNLIGLLGGLREPDSLRISGIPAIALGMAMFGGVYVLVAWMIYRKRTPRSLLFSIFLAYLGMFVFAPRMHERYMYPALAILIPLAFDSPATLAIFATLSATFLFNLAHVYRFTRWGVCWRRMTALPRLPRW